MQNFTLLKKIILFVYVLFFVIGCQPIIRRVEFSEFEFKNGISIKLDKVKDEFTFDKNSDQEYSKWTKDQDSLFIIGKGFDDEDGDKSFSCMVKTRIKFDIPLKKDSFECYFEGKGAVSLKPGDKKLFNVTPISDTGNEKKGYKEYELLFKLYTNNKKMGNHRIDRNTKITITKAKTFRKSGQLFVKYKTKKQDLLEGRSFSYLCAKK